MGHWYQMFDLESARTYLQLIFIVSFLKRTRLAHIKFKPSSCDHLLNQPKVNIRIMWLFQYLIRTNAKLELNELSNLPKVLHFYNLTVKPLHATLLCKSLNKNADVYTYGRESYLQKLEIVSVFSDSTSTGELLSLSPHGFCSAGKGAFRLVPQKGDWFSSFRSDFLSLSILLFPFIIGYQLRDGNSK